MSSQERILTERDIDRSLTQREKEERLELLSSLGINSADDLNERLRKKFPGTKSGDRMWMVRLILTVPPGEDLEAMTKILLEEKEIP